MGMHNILLKKKLQKTSQKSKMIWRQKSMEKILCATIQLNLFSMTLSNANVFQNLSAI